MMFEDCPPAPLPQPTAEDAKGRVDSWGPPTGDEFGIHAIARALRAEIARLEAQRDTLQEAGTRVITQRREAEARAKAAAEQVHALRRAIGRMAARLSQDEYATDEAVIEDLRAMSADPK